MNAWLSVAVMSGITMFLRATPLLLRRSLLRAPWMLRLNRALPLCVMVILIVHSIGRPAVSDAWWPHLWPQLVALGAVAASYLRWRQAMGSIVLGLVVLGLLTHAIHPPLR